MAKTKKISKGHKKWCRGKAPSFESGPHTNSDLRQPISVNPSAMSDSEDDVQIIDEVPSQPLVLELILGIKQDPRGMLLLCQWEGLEEPTWEPLVEILWGFPMHLHNFAEILIREFRQLALL